MATPVKPPAMDASNSNSNSNSGDVDVETVHQILGIEMNRMSPQKLYRVDLDVKGKNMLAAIEPAELSTLGLQALDKELQETKDRKFYDKATVGLGSTMVTSREFRLKFARAEAFDPVKAAARIEAHLGLLYENFGEQGLLRPIRMSDLDKSERDLIKSGTTQLLPCRDKAGRRIVARLGPYGTSRHTTRNKIRVMMYITQVLSEDEETQKQGAVLLHWPLQKEHHTQQMGPLRNAIMCAPFRFSALHFCFGGDQRLATIAVQAILLGCPELRPRCRIHVGSVTECQYALMSYGISSDFTPITNTGNLKTQNHQKWIAYRQAKERALQNGTPFDGIDCPSVKDVLAGKGPHVSNHPGNFAFRKMMETRFEEHRDAIVIERKTAITWEVVLEVQRRGARFLVKDECWWAIADQDAAREKVSVAFRDMRKSFASREKALNKKRSDNDSDNEVLSDIKKIRITA